MTQAEYDYTKHKIAQYGNYAEVAKILGVSKSKIALIGKSIGLHR